MDVKNRLTGKLLKIAKKHRILTYPVLALVALISVFSYFFDWSTGAGKRVVAVVMVMVMIVSQSCFLTSSATEVTDDAVVQEEVQNQDTDTNELDNQEGLLGNNNLMNDEEPDSDIVDDESIQEGLINEDVSDLEVAEEELLQEEGLMSEINLLAEGVTANVIFDYVDYNGQNAYPISNTLTIDSNAEGTTFDLLSLKSGLVSLRNGYDADDPCYKYSGLYLDVNCSVSVPDELDVNSPYLNDNGVSKTLVIYCLREVENYEVTILPNGTGEDTDIISYQTDVAGSVSETPATIYVPATGDANNKSGSFVINNANRYGYDVAEPSVSDGGNCSAIDGGGYTINLVGQNSAQRTVTLNWTGKKYQIRYCKKKSTDATITDTDYTIQTITYGSNDTFYTQNAAGTVDYPGYDFSSWALGSATCLPGSTITMTNHHEMYQPDPTTPITLYPNYTYAGIVVDTTEIPFQFGVAQSETIKAKYDYKVSGKDKDGQFTYTIDGGCITALQNVGIIVTHDENGIYLNTDGPTATTLNTSQDIKFTVQDENNIPTETITISITIAPQTVSVAIPDNWKVKDYDGNANVNTYFTDTLPTNQKFPNGADITVSRADAYYDSANAGTDKTITITGCAIKNVPAEYAGCYVLEADAGTIVVGGCTIKKRTVIVHTTSTVNEIRAGEPNPDASNFGIELDDGSSFVGTDDLASLGEITYTIDPSREDDLEAAYDKCYIIAHAADNSNYTVKCYKDDCAYFKVTKEAPVLNVNYTISGSVSDDDWYVGAAPVLSPITSSGLLGGGYNQIRISYDGTAFTEWASAVTLDPDKYSGNSVWVQLRNRADSSSTTGAITSIGTANIDFDPEGPKYLGYSFTVDGDDSISYDWDNQTTLGNGGLYFPSHGGVLSFGTYINATIHIKVRFEDKGSGLKNLSYGIYTSTPDKVTTFDENGVASIEVLQSAVKNGYGVIKCQAMDVAGNKSDLITLRPSGNTNDDYEWSVESREPSKCELSVTYGDMTEGGVRGHVANKSGIYYRNCIANVYVVESESGIKNVKWYVNDTLVDTQYPNGASAIQTPSEKITSGDFSFGNNTVFTSSKTAYTIYAVAEDNAGNTKTSDKITFLVDNDPPLLDVDYEENPDNWTSNESITFTTSDAVSGVAYAKILKSDGTTTNIALTDPSETGEYTGSFSVTGKGEYTVIVCDNAGNESRKSFNIQNVSVEAPECPIISSLPEIGGEADSSGWYNSETGAPTIHIEYDVETKDGAPVNTYYRHYKNDETAYDDALIEDNSGVKDIAIDENDEAIHYFKAWSVSASGIECIDTDNHLTVVKYDKTAPEITVSNIPEKSSGSSVYIEFSITDAVSGVDKDSITVMRNGKPYTATVEEVEGGYAGSFVVEVSERGNYVVMASDIAGNEMSVAGFTPMSMFVSPISNITTSKATLSATVTRGTAEVSVAPVIMLRKATDESFVESENTVASQDENGNWSLSTVFDNLEANTVYDYKVRAVSDINEVLEYEGSFKTSSLNDEGGIIRGTTGYPSGMQLPSWNSSGIITVGLFEGNVCIAATTADAGGPFAFVNIPDGTYNIVATDGVYKKSLGITVSNHVVISPSSGISLILSGHNTSVVILNPDTPNITVDNMDSIFVYDHVNFNEEDSQLIEEDGTVEFRLYASLMDVTNVTSDELAVIGRVQSKEKVVRKYLNLTLYKYVTDKYGVQQPPIPVTELSNGASITITIPLQDLSGVSGIEVVRVHNGSSGLEGYRYEVDMDSSPSTFTLTSNKFSTYAILAPKEEPTTEPTTTEELPTEEPSTQQPATRQRYVVQIENQVTTESSTQTTTGSNASTSFSYVSSGSGGTKTGDAAPIAGLCVMMMLSIGGFVVLRKKSNSVTK
ncbi:MAG: hypothetical protein ACI4F4_06760 [Lachnospiraceae bacterium]